MDYKVSCETLVRLQNIISVQPDEKTPWTGSIRLEANYAIAFNRQIMAIERLPHNNPDQAISIILDSALLKQVKTEAPFKSDLFVTPVEALKFASAKTTMGYNHSENIVVWHDGENKIDRWREMIPKEPNTEWVGGMFWNTAQIELLSKSSPSGCIVFQDIIDVDRPIVVRDINDPNWFGMFIGSTVEREYSPASVPEWLV